MNEKEIRERIERFLKKTARNVVVPASMGLGLSLSGCGGKTLHVGPADAGGDATSLSTSDARSSDASDVETILDAGAPDASPDLSPDALPDTSVDATSDLPTFYPPYLIMVPSPDARADLPGVAPPYMPPPQPDAGPPDLPGPMPVYIDAAIPGTAAAATPPRADKTTESPPPHKDE